MRLDFFERSSRDQAEIGRAGRRPLRLRLEWAILPVNIDLLRSEFQRGGVSRRHQPREAEDALVESQGCLDIDDGDHEVVDAFDHRHASQYRLWNRASRVIPA